jgi:hypothetical protein
MRREEGSRGRDVGNGLLVYCVVNFLPLLPCQSDEAA